MTSPTVSPSSARGRPAATTHAAIEKAAFELFAQHGFEATTVDMIAARLGVSRRTVTRYYPSKNDIAWGQFSQTLTGFAALLDQMPDDLPVWQAVQRGVLAFNDFPASEMGFLRERMRLILATPTLQAHSTLRYVEWRDVVASYVARRNGTSMDDLAVQVVSNVCLGMAISAYEAWLADPEARLGDLLEGALGSLRSYLLPDPVQVKA